MMFTTYFPLMLRGVIVVALWLCAVPWLTTRCYRMWFYRSRLFDTSSLAERLQFPMILSDIRSGVILNVAIVCSFLAFMSFAEFVRFDVVREEDDRNNDVVAAGDNQPIDQQEIPDQPPVLRRRRRERNDDPDDENENDDQAAEPDENAARANNFENDGAVEMHIALDHILGFTGQFSVLLRNVFWFVTFNLAYLGLFAFLPFSLGKSEGFSKLTDLAKSVVNALPGLELGAQVADVFRNETEKARETHEALQFTDILTTVWGYIFLCTSLLVWGFLSSKCVTWFSLQRRFPMVEMFLVFFECSAAVIKVTVLLILKMILLPIALGCCIDIATMHVFGSTFLDRMTFSVQHMLGSFLIHWVLGITFMLVVTVAVLQLREVLHPALLGSVIRPQEAQQELFKALLEEPCRMHARKMILSLLIYFVLLLLLISIPLNILSALSHWLDMEIFPLEIHLTYFCAEIQIPIELIVAHLFALSFLEMHKNRIGHIQHVVLVKLCSALGLTEYLLPLWKLPEKKTHVSTVPIVVHPPPLLLQPPNDQVQRAAKRRASMERDAMRVAYNEMAQANDWDPKRVERIGRYIRSCPWPESEHLYFETRLHPRSKPTHCIERVGLLVLIAWLGTAILFSAAMLAPLFFGRVLHTIGTYLIGSFPNHEPMSVGLFLMLLPILLRVVKVFHYLLAKSSLAQTISWFILSPLYQGVAITLFFRLKSFDGIISTISILRWIQIWMQVYVIGFLVIHIGIYLACQTEFAELRALEKKMAEDNPPEQTNRELRHVINIDDTTGFLEVLRLCVREYVNTCDEKDERRCRDSICRQHILTKITIPLLKHVNECVFVPLILCRQVLSFIAPNWIVVVLFRLAVVGKVSIFLWDACKETIMSCKQSIHNRIRDDKYLIGRQLRNMAR